MALVTKVEPLDDWIRITVDQTLSPKARSAAVAKFAADALTTAEQQNLRVLGRVPPHSIAVDGRAAAPLESVDPDRGVIVFEFELVTDVLVWIGDTLRARSPVSSGHYRDAHTLLADGVEVPIGAVVPQAQEYIFVNPLPYARKLEIGKTESGRDFLVSVPNQIYERTAADAKRRFGNIAKVVYRWQSLKGGAIEAWAQSPGGRRAAAKRGGRPELIHDWLTKQPAIIVTPN